MPAEFDACVAAGGAVRTLPDGRLVCFPPDGGEAVVAEREDED